MRPPAPVVAGDGRLLDLESSALSDDAFEAHLRARYLG